LIFDFLTRQLGVGLLLCEKIFGIMKWRNWYLSMGITAVVIFASMLYLGTFLCVPMENASCVSFWK